jgi:glycosyltransferase involved in cell wall biosynthesis
MRAGFVYLPGRLKRLQSGKAVPSEFFLGAIEMKKNCHDVAMIEVRDNERPTPIESLFRLCAGNKLLPPKSHSAQLWALRSIASQLREMDVVVGTSSSVAFGLTLWKCLLGLRFQVLGIHAGILHYAYTRLKLRSTRWLLRRMYSQTFANYEMQEMIRRFEIPPYRIETNPFGVDLEFWKPSAYTTKRCSVVAVGSDAQRDWSTLLAAAEGARWHLTLVTSRVVTRALPSNVELRYGSYAQSRISDAELRDLYSAATCVVVPLKASSQPSGQSVTLQAMACRSPVVLSRSPGQWDTVTMRNRQHLCLVEPEDAVSLRLAIDELCDDVDFRERVASNGLHYVRARGNILDFARRLEIRCRHLVAQRGQHALAQPEGEVEARQ